MRKTAGSLRERVYRANVELVESGLVFGTFGNVSGADREAGLFYIKPSGIPYDELSPDTMVPVSLGTGEAVEDELRPSSDTPTHLELYRAFPCGGVAHTHSEFATTLAQARLPLRCMGTTHADYFRRDVPVTRELTPEEIAQAYETNTGLVIVETFRAEEIPPDEVGAVLVANHGPFTWGATPEEAVDRSRVLEYLARMECTLRTVTPEARPPSRALVDKHFLRKHGPDAYYGQT